MAEARGLWLCCVGAKPWWNGQPSPEGKSPEKGPGAVAVVEAVVPTACLSQALGTRASTTLSPFSEIYFDICPRN